MDETCYVLMPLFDITEKRPCINIFKLSGTYYFKHFFNDPELFRAFEKARYRFKMATYGESHHNLTCSDPDVSAKAAGHCRETMARYYNELWGGAVCEAAACFCGVALSA
ncbi:MAG: hypothetical protein OIN88_00445 [Candidatus Methanoperedens sp.]|nr:hypothetical protein [Candidatus Methanoperedens sp.]